MKKRLVGIITLAILFCFVAGCAEQAGEAYEKLSLKSSETLTETLDCNGDTIVKNSFNSKGRLVDKEMLETCKTRCVKTKVGAYCEKVKLPERTPTTCEAGTVRTCVGDDIQSFSVTSNCNRTELETVNCEDGCIQTGNTTAICITYEEVKRCDTDSLNIETFRVRSDGEETHISSEPCEYGRCKFFGNRDTSCVCTSTTVRQCIGNSIRIYDIDGSCIKDETSRVPCEQGCINTSDTTAICIRYEELNRCNNGSVQHVRVRSDGEETITSSTRCNGGICNPISRTEAECECTAGIISFCDDSGFLTTQEVDSNCTKRTRSRVTCDTRCAPLTERSAECI